MIVRRIAFLLVVAGLACPLVTPAIAADAPAPVIRVGATANDTYAEAYYAQELGFFKKAGLNVEVTTFTNGATVAQAIASGAVDVGVSNVVQLATANQHGIPFAYFAGGGMYTTTSPTTALSVAKTSAIKDVKEFEGKTIAVSTLKDTSMLATQTWLTQNGADVAKISFVEMPFASMGPALQRGTVAGAVISEPSLTAATTESAKIFGKSYDGIAKEFMISGWFSTADYRKKNPDALKRFERVMYETARWANAHHDESAAILAKVSKVSPEIAHTMTRCVYAESLDPKFIQPTLDLAFKYKLLERHMNAAEIIATP